VEKSRIAFVLHQASHSRMKLKADAFKLYANGFQLIDFVKAKEKKIHRMQNYFKEFFSQQCGEKKSPRRRFRLHTLER
jgi:hypothetical protein